MKDSSHTHEVIYALIDAFGKEQVYDETPWKFDVPEL